MSFGVFYPLYSPYKTLTENMKNKPAKYTFLGHSVNSLFGISACPAATNSDYIRAAFANGYDIVTTKTQRSVRWPANVFPNVLQLDIDGHLTLDRSREPITGYLPESIDPTDISIANSCGNNSEGPDLWVDDLRKSLEAAGPNQLLIASVVGTIKDGFGPEQYHNDFAETAGLAVSAGVKVIELNLSCPNVASEGIICYSPEVVLDISKRVREHVGSDVKILGKIAYFTPLQEELLFSVVRDSSKFIDGLTAINTLAAPIVDRKGEQAFPGPGREKAGVSGAAIKWAGIDMVSRLNNIRRTLDIDFTIVGVGGVMKPEDYSDYIAVGADAVLSATGAMWNPELGVQVKRYLSAPFIKH